MIKYSDTSKEIIYEQIQYALKSSINFVEIQFHGEEEECHVPKHWHRSIEMILPVFGSTEAWIDGQIYHVHPDEFLIINSQNIHSCRGSYPNERYYGYAIQIKYDFIKSCFEDIDQYDFQISYKGQHKDSILHCLKDMIDIHKSIDPLRDIQLQGKIYELIYLLLNNTLQENHNHLQLRSEKQKNKLINILNYIDEHYIDIIEVNDIANHFHMSYGYIAQLFKDYLNMSITEYLNSIRIHQIERDLILTDLSITEICLKHGFTNTKSFYREFSKYHDITPKEYRKTAIKK